MQIAIAVLTWNRINALKEIMAGLERHCSQHAIAVFDDGGFTDGTARWLKSISSKDSECPLIESECWAATDRRQYFIGKTNLGVAGNSNRALKWFERGDFDYLLLCNDDLTVLGDFASMYVEASRETGIEHFCFCDSDSFESAEYVKTRIRLGKYVVQELNRLTGSCLLISRKLVQEIGFFDTKFGKFGEEHCDFTGRCRAAGFLNYKGEHRFGLDIEGIPLKQQKVESTLTDSEKKVAAKKAFAAYSKVNYLNGYYRPFSLRTRKFAGGLGDAGIPVSNLVNHAVH